MREISQNAVELAVRVMADVAITNESYFSEVDSLAGDADFGISLANGFRAVLNQWDSVDHSSISSFLTSVGVIFTKNVGGCSGPIWGTAFMKAGIASKSKKSLTLPELVLVLRAAIDGIMARGGAQPGDKTLLDALVPATDKIEELSEREPSDVLVALEKAAEVATEAVETTKGWEAKQGRQSFTGKRSIGTEDPGIVAVAKMMQEVAKTLKHTCG